jgi:isochorismate synthase EntC
MLIGDIGGKWCYEIYNVKEISLNHFACNQGNSHPVKWSEPSLDDFTEKVSVFRELVTSSGLLKGVIVLSSSALFPSLTHFELVNTLLSKAFTYAKKEEVYVAGYWHDDGGFITVTPEFLAKASGNLLYSGALAGTVASHGMEPFGTLAKLGVEHEITLRGILEALQTFGEPNVHPRTEVDLGYAKHFFTRISLQLSKSSSLSEILSALTPTPALACYPLNLRDKWLRRGSNVLSENSLWGGGLVVENGINDWLSVALIRGVEWRKTPKGFFVTVRAGAGYVKESDPESEWREINHKINSIKKIFYG